ncbi:RelA/SpoT family protein [Pelistega ratti]|uniref:RelA/SpoT family protein n=1 Tax=Pelistega ratti TaxID=2652177 RepID=UPI001359B598|nr:bifunctional (p)ppGpp synthetase/guanosine-3',5'-bis(diphosphate) 3'-pyrophosphohydrolase [Pelistega ratti]
MGIKNVSSSLLHALRENSPFRKRVKKALPTDTPSFSPDTTNTGDLLYPLITQLKTYLSPSDIEQVREAYRFADKAHLGQMRSSGEAYITHPVAVTEICAQWKLDASALMAALLHDVIEDQGIEKAEIAERFNTDVAELVDGLTKLERINFASKSEQQAESFRKMLLATAKDVRVILVKLSDRLHNMRTLGGVEPSKARRVSNETLEIYAPIANRLGLNHLVREFEDLAFEAYYPNRYRVLKQALENAHNTNRNLTHKITDSIRAALPAYGIEGKLIGREKTLFSIHKKMKEQKKSFSEVLDIYGFRIIVNTLTECYIALGVLHQLYRPIPGKFKDYIALPKINGYQSLHTTLVGPYGTPIEFQIRTTHMDHIAEEGIAAHWIYKTDNMSLSDLQKQTHRWLQSLLDIQSQTSDSSEFIDNVKVDLFPDAVYVLTPKGKIISLPRGATPIDFAYSIHTKIGNHAISALINGKEAPLKTPLVSGDTVQIITNEKAAPNIQWLNFVRTGKARSEIRHYLKTVNLEESIQFGEKLLRQALRELNIDIPSKDDPTWEKLAKESGGHSIDEILMDIGVGRRLAAVVARRFLIDSPLIATSAADIDELNAARSSPILIQGNEGQSVTLSPCCTPIPGDNVIAVVRPGYGLVVHTEDCPIAIGQRAKEPERWVSVAWDQEYNKHLSTRLLVTIQNEKGVIGRIAGQIASVGSNIIRLHMPDESMGIADLQLTVQVEDRNHLATVIRAIRQVPQVLKIVRIKGYY